MRLNKIFRKPKSWRNLIENVLSTVLFFIALYLILTPFLPEIMLWWDKTTDKTQGFVYASNHPLAPQNQENSAQQSNIPKEDIKPIPKDNRLVIPAINVDVKITEGTNAGALKDGAWRRPKTSTPDIGGNTVMAAHRFTYNVNYPSYFYALDKVKTGDPIIVYWKEKEYNYVVSDIKVVKATEISIEENTTDPILTLYTCTPLWTAKDRLVVIAKPI